MRYIGHWVVSGCDYNIGKSFSGDFFFDKILNFYSELFILIWISYVITDCIVSYVLADVIWRETMYKILSKIMTGEIRRHWLAIEMFLKGVVRILKTFLRSISPKVFVCRGNRQSIFVDFIFDDVVPLATPFFLFLNTYKFYLGVPFLILTLKSSKKR